MNLTARLLKIAKSHSFKVGDLTPDDLEQAESYIIKNSMKLTKEELNKGKLQSLRSKTLQGLQRCYEMEDFPILMYNDPVSYLWMKKVHTEGHTGITKTRYEIQKKSLDNQSSKISYKSEEVLLYM